MRPRLDASESLHASVLFQHLSPPEEQQARLHFLSHVQRPLFGVVSTVNYSPYFSPSSLKAIRSYGFCTQSTAKDKTYCVCMTPYSVSETIQHSYGLCSQRFPVIHIGYNVLGKHLKQLLTPLKKYSDVLSSCITIIASCCCLSHYICYASFESHLTTPMPLWMSFDLD